MCIEKIHRFMMATVLIIGGGLLLEGIQEGLYVVFFVAFMLVVYGITDFCPSVSILKKLGIKPCGK